MMILKTTLVFSADSISINIRRTYGNCQKVNKKFLKNKKLIGLNLLKVF